MQRCLTFDKYNRRFIKTSSSQHLIICTSSFVFDYDAPQDKLLDERQNRSPRKAGEQLLGALFSVPTSPPLSTGANVAPTFLRTCVSSQRPPQRTGSPPGPPSSSSLCTVMDTRHHASHVVHIAPGDGHRSRPQGARWPWEQQRKPAADRGAVPRPDAVRLRLKCKEAFHAVSRLRPSIQPEPTPMCRRIDGTR